MREFPQDYEMTLSPMGIYRMLALNVDYLAPHLWELYDDLKEIDRVWVDYTTKEWKEMSHIDYIEKADKFFKEYGDKLKEFTEFRFGDGKKPTKRKTHKKRSKK